MKATGLEIAPILRGFTAGSEPRWCGTVAAMRIWLDTDIGSDVDDALALAYILRHPDLELIGISTVFGDVELRGRIAAALMEAAEADPVPILNGLGVPLSDRRNGIMFGHEGRGLLVEPEPTLRVREEPGGAARIEELAGALDDSNPDMVVAIGPMTNLGALADIGATLPPLAVMGGKLTDVMLPGMVAEISEWNWHCDPDAVAKTLRVDHETNPLIVPAEVTFLTRLPDDDIARLADGDPLNRLLAALCREWLDAQRQLFNIDKPIVALHDPLTAAVLVEPALCGYADRRIEVDGAAVARDVDGPPNIRAAATVDTEAARANVMAVLTGSADDGLQAS